MKHDDQLIYRLVSLHTGTGAFQILARAPESNVLEFDKLPAYVIKPSRSLPPVSLQGPT